MADFVLQALPTFPVGTDVGAYSASDWLHHEAKSGEPPGTAVDEQTVDADGSVTFTGLTAGADYYAVGEVATDVWRYVRFRAAANVDPSQDHAQQSDDNAFTGDNTFTGAVDLSGATVTPPTSLATQAELDAHADDTAIHSSGRELEYAEITSNHARVVGSGDGAGNGADITGLSVTVTVGTRPIEIEFWAGAVSHSAANASLAVRLFEGSTMLSLGSLDGSLNTANKGVPCSVKRRLAPSAGSHTYKAVLWVNTVGTATVTAGTIVPAFIRVVEC